MICSRGFAGLIPDVQVIAGKDNRSTYKNPDVQYFVIQKHPDHGDHRQTGKVDGGDDSGGREAQRFGDAEMRQQSTGPHQ